MPSHRGEQSSRSSHAPVPTLQPCCSQTGGTVPYHRAPARDIRALPLLRLSIAPEINILHRDQVRLLVTAFKKTTKQPRLPQTIIKKKNKLMFPHQEKAQQVLRLHLRASLWSLGSHGTVFPGNTKLKAAFPKGLSTTAKQVWMQEATKAQESMKRFSSVLPYSRL